MVSFDTNFIEIIERTRDVKSFRLRVKADTSFKPGQYFLITITVEGALSTKPFSISSSPTEKGYIEFTKRLTGSPFSKALTNLRIGDAANIRMPYGAFTFEGEYEKIAFLSGGVGITPIRSICKFATDKKLPTDIALLYGNNEARNIIFKHDFDRMQKDNKNLRVIYTLTSPDVDAKTWPGRAGYIDERMLKQELPDYKERLFYVCGPPKMVEGLVAVLKDKLAVQLDKIRLENFSGY